MSGLRRTMWLAGLVFLLTFTAVGGLAVTWFRSAAEPRIMLLGSGGAVSVLVTAGSTRLLIATGGNTTAFGNALNAALPPTIRRLDVLLVTGDDQGSTVASHALRTRNARYRAFIGPPRSDALDLASDLNVETITTPPRFQLAEGVSVTLHIDSTLTSEGSTFWYATINHGGTTVIILSDGSAAANLPPTEFISALVVVRGRPDGALARFDIHALMLSENNTQKVNWQEDLAGGTSPGLLVLPIADGQVETLRFVERGLQLPQDARALPTVDPSASR